MLANHSPQKENRSPSPKKLYPSQTKSSSILQELRQLLKNHNIPIPTHLINDKDQNGTQSIKLFEAVDPLQFAKVKARLADKEFQVKRLEEDFAQHKLLTRLQYQKGTKKLREEVCTLKNKMNDDNNKWGQKFTETTQRLANECQNFKEQTEKHLRELTDKEIIELKTQYSQEINKLKEDIQYQKKRYTRTVQTMKMQHEQKITIIETFHSKEVKNLNQNLQETVKKTQEVYEARIYAVECEKNAEIKQVEEVKQTTGKKEQKYLTQIGLLQRDKNQLFQKLDNTEMRLKVVQKKYDDLSNSMNRLKDQNELRLAQLSEELLRTKNQTEDTIDSQRLKILKQHYEKTQILQKRLRELENIKENIVKEFKSNQKYLDVRFQRRESRKEDVEFIKEIEYKLAEKQKETSQLYHNLKYFQLQKQNNDKIYSRIFVSNKQKKGASCRHDRDIYSIMKQAQTTDVRHHVLKITPKETRR